MFDYTSQTVLLAGLLISGAGAFAFSLLETAYTLLPRERIKEWAAENSRFSFRVKRLTENRKKLLGFFDFLEIIIAGIYFYLLTLFTLFQPYVSKDRFSSNVSASLVFGAGIFLYAFLCRFLPRKLGQLHVEKIVKNSSLFLAIPFQLFGWIEPLLDGFSNTLSHLVSKQPRRKTASLSEGEIKMLVTLGKEEQLEIEEEEKEMIESVVTFGQTIVKEVMVPRIDMVCLDVETSASEILDTAASHRHTKYPVYEGTPDNIIGIVQLQDLFRMLREKENPPSLKELLRKPLFVPESKKVDDLLREMQKEKISMAIVVDEYGGTDGLVTIEDLVEEIVGEIEEDRSSGIPDILQLGENRYLVDGKINMEDLNAELELSLPTEEFETLSGYIYSLLGRVPEVGEKIEADSVHLEIAVVHRQRIAKIILTRKTAVPETSSSPENP